MSHVVRSALDNKVPVRLLLYVTPVLLIGLAVDCLAQATGAAIGAGRSTVLLTAYEFHRGEINRTAARPHD